MRDAKAEMEALWAAVFGQPPAIDADPSLLAQLILRCSGPPPVYDFFTPPRVSPSVESKPADEHPPSLANAAASTSG